MRKQRQQQQMPQVTPSEVEFKSKQFIFGNGMLLDSSFDNLQTDQGSQVVGEWLSDKAIDGWIPRSINEYVLEGNFLLISILLWRVRESNVLVADAMPPTIYEPRK